MTGETADFIATQRDPGDGMPSATVSFPYDRTSVERFRATFPRARWRDDLKPKSQRQLSPVVYRIAHVFELQVGVSAFHP